MRIARCLAVGVVLGLGVTSAGGLALASPALPGGAPIAVAQGTREPATGAGPAGRPPAVELLRRDQVERLAQLEGRWRLAFWAIVALATGLAVMGAVAAIAQRRARGALHFARSMAQELDERRRVGLAERQQSAQRIVELEQRVRQLEGHAGDAGHVSRRA